MKLGFVFTSAPHACNSGREGLDALLAASAYSEDIAVFFVGDGASQLLSGQEPGGIFSRDYSPAFKLMALYDVEQVYICEASLAEMGLAQAELVLAADRLPRQALAEKLHQCDKLLTF
jgi:tRNA 2-thiouridine synthesizing protein C